MKRTTGLLVLTTVLGGLCTWLLMDVWRPATAAAQGTAPPAPAAADPAPSPDEVAVRKSIEAFVRAANARDAKAAAALWSEGAEFTDIDDTVFRGRAELEKMFAETHKTSPRGKAEIQVESFRSLGKNLCATEGTIRFVPVDGKGIEVTHYSALHVREGDGWLIAMSQEWESDQFETDKLTDLEWLIGDWEAKRGDHAVSTNYSWGDEKAFIQCRYKVTEKGKTTASGTEILAVDPTTRQIRGWLFDRSGTLAEATWSRDGNRWVVEIAGSTADGDETVAVNAIVPIGKDAFSWVSVDRTLAGEPLPNVAPIRVTRVKK